MDGAWMEIAKRSLIHRNMVEHIKPQKPTHVSCVKVWAPADREDEPVCRIYGEVSFQVGGSSTTLFSRGPHQPDIIHLMGDDNYLTFSDSDNHGSARALPPVSPTDPLRIKMALTEITTSGKHVKIAKMDECYCEDDDSGMELGKCLFLDGLDGFEFDVCYSVVYGAPVEVGAAIMKQGEGDNVMSCQVIAYHLSVKDPKDPLYEGLLPQTRALLTSVNSMTVEPWKAIDFERKFVVAPIRDGQFLSFLLGIAMNGEEEVEYYDVDFPLMHSWNDDTNSLWASKDMVHIKNLWLPSGTNLALSLTFLP